MSGIASYKGCGNSRQIDATITHITYATKTIVDVLTTISGGPRPEARGPSQRPEAEGPSQRPPAERSFALLPRLRIGIRRRRRREQHLDRAHARDVDRRLDLDALEHAVVARHLRHL